MKKTHEIYGGHCFYKYRIYSTGNYGPLASPNSLLVLVNLRIKTKDCLFVEVSTTSSVSGNYLKEKYSINGMDYLV